MIRLLVVFATGCLACAPSAAPAADLASPSLPMFAAVPPGSPPSTSTSTSPSSPWSGLYAGTEVFAIGGSHIQGMVGGGGYVGYDHEFDNRIVLGVQASSGVARGSTGFAGFNGFNYAGTAVRVGYDMGRLMPYAFAGVDLAKPTFRGSGGIGASDGINGLFSGRGKLTSFTTVGAGIDYKVTNRLTIGLSVAGTQARGPGAYGPYGVPAP